MFKFRLNLTVFFLLASGIAALAQNTMLRGTVLDENDLPLPGTSVIIDGTTKGVITDVDGKFEILAGKGETLVVEFLGYVPKTLTVGNENNIRINLEPSTEFLEETVVVGYGVQKKVNVTGAVATVDYAEMSMSRPVTSTSSLLRGASPGLYIFQGSGKPGEESVTMRIRGIGTLNNSDPLVIIDGFEGSLDRVNPTDIETVSVLKDAASCAIYGNRGANGVILITTKTQKEGTFKVDYSGMFAYQEPANYFETITNYADYMEIMNESARNIDKTPIYSQTMIDIWREAERDPNGLAESGYPNYVAYPNVDWQKALFTPGLYQKHSLSAGGTSKNTKYLISLDYMDNPGIVEGTGVKKMSYRVNLSSQVTKWLEIGAKVYGFRQNREINDWANSSGYMNRAVPGIYPYYDGKYGWMENPEQSTDSRNNLYFINRAHGQSTVHYINTTGFLKITLPLDIKYNASFNYGYRHGYEYFVRGLGNGYSFSTDKEAYWYDNLTNCNRTESNTGSYTWTFQTDFSWNRTIAGKHDVSAIVGFEAFESYQHTGSAQKRSFENAVLEEMDNIITPVSASGSTTEFATSSLFARASYAYDGRYMAEVNLRYDGSSRFASESRWGLFPAVSAGWRISEEPWLSDVRILDNLKLRASWGQLGNHSVGNYAYLSTYSSGYTYPFGGKLQAGYVSTLSNNLLEWETTTTTDVGLDLAMFGNRLTFETDFYHKYTDGILYRAPISATVGTKNPPVQNLCGVINDGIEFSLGWKDSIGDFTYGISANFTRNWNVVSKYNGALEAGWVTDENGVRTYETNLGDVSTYIDATRRVIEGRQINEFRVLEVYRGSGDYFFADGSVNPAGGPKDGMIRTEKDMEWLQAMIEAGNKFLPNEKVGKTGIWYGDMIYSDANGDGIYGDDNDYTFQGKNQTPKFYYGMNINLGWKGLDFSMQLVGAGGAAMYWRYSGFNSYGTRNEHTLPKAIAYDHYYYDPENPDDPRTNLTSKHGRLTNNFGSEQNGGNVWSDHWLYSTDYLKIKSVTLGYTFPERWMKAIKVRSARIFLSGDNLHTFTNYPGVDPEFSDKYNYYSSLRQYTVGVNISF